MFESFVQACLITFDPFTFALIWLGSIIGLIVGIIPGLTALVAMALVLPFVFGFKPEAALPLMVAIGSTGVTGGSITAILLNVPGTPPNAATLIDGYPMCKKGEGGRAIGAALTSSGLGGLVGVLMALPMIPLLMTFIMAFGTPELFALVILGISFIGVIGSGSVTKGFISGFLGLLISLIGFQASTGMSRFTFGSTFLYDGIGIIPFVMGLFAFPELIEFAQGKSISQDVKVGKEITRDLVEGFFDTFRHFWLFMRSSVVGFIVGLIPGIGGEVAIFMAYGQAVRTSKHPEKFGTGVVEGVIAPESANNAKEGGALLCTLALGLPGSSMMVLLLGGFVAVGLAPGPGMLTEHLDLSLSLFLTTVLANIIGAVICFALSRYIVKISYVNTDYLFPIISVFVFLGAYAHSDDLLNIVIVFAVGILGYYMKKFDYSRPALLLGFVLGFLFEKNFFISLGVYGPAFLLRPLVLAMFVIVIFIATYDLLKTLLHKIFGREINEGREK